MPSWAYITIVASSAPPQPIGNLANPAQIALNTESGFKSPLNVLLLITTLGQYPVPNNFHYSAIDLSIRFSEFTVP